MYFSRVEGEEFGVLIPSHFVSDKFIVAKFDAFSYVQYFTGKKFWVRLRN